MIVSNQIIIYPWDRRRYAAIYDEDELHYDTSGLVTLDLISVAAVGY